MKDRINYYMSYIEVATEELKIISKVITNLKLSFDKEEEEETQKVIAADYFMQSQLSNLIYQDLVKTMTKLAECYSTCIALKIDLRLSDGEVKILDNYLAEATNLFGVEKGKLKSKQEDLEDIMHKRAMSKRNDPEILQFIRTS